MSIEVASRTFLGHEDIPSRCQLSIRSKVWPSRRDLIKGTPAAERRRGGSLPPAYTVSPGDPPPACFRTKAIAGNHGTGRGLRARGGQRSPRNRMRNDRGFEVKRRRRRYRIRDHSMTCQSSLVVTGSSSEVRPVKPSGRVEPSQEYRSAAFAYRRHSFLENMRYMVRPSLYEDPVVNHQKHWTLGD